MSQAPSPGASDRTFVQLLAAALILILAWKIPQSQFWKTNSWRILFGGTAVLVSGAVYAAVLLWNRVLLRGSTHVTGYDERAVRLGTDAKGKPFYLKEEFRSAHTHVLGTTSAGKTSSFILPSIIQDIKNGSGLLIVDGKADRSLLDQVYAHAVRHRRKKNFRLFSLAYPELSWGFNPFIGCAPDEAAERVFASFPITNEYYRGIQYKIFLALVTLIHERGRVPTFALIQRLLTDMTALAHWIEGYQNPAMFRILSDFKNLEATHREKQISGLESCLCHFTLTSAGNLFNKSAASIQLDEALEKNQILYFQLPTMRSPFLGEAAGKLVLQSLQGAVSNRHIGKIRNKKFFACYLDDFQDYIYPKFIALLNKSSSARIGVVFSHQALGDLDKLGADFRNGVVTCTNVKVIMRTSDPDTRDFYARSIGTVSTEKVTERQNEGLLGTTKTGEGSAREVKEYIHHPDEIRALRRGEAVVAISHPGGVTSARVRLEKPPDLKPRTLPTPPERTDSPTEELPSFANGNTKPAEL